MNTEKNIVPTSSRVSPLPTSLGSGTKGAFTQYANNPLVHGSTGIAGRSCQVVSHHDENFSSSSTDANILSNDKLNLVEAESFNPEYLEQSDEEIKDPSVKTMKYSPNGKYLILAVDKCINVISLDKKNAQTVPFSMKCEDSLWKVNISPDSCYIAASIGRHLKIMRVNDLKVLGTINLPEDESAVIDSSNYEGHFSPDSRNLFVMPTFVIPGFAKFDDFIQGKMTIFIKNKDGTWTIQREFKVEVCLLTCGVSFRKDSDYAIVAINKSQFKVLGLNGEGVWEDRLDIDYEGSISFSIFSLDGCSFFTGSFDGVGIIKTINSNNELKGCAVLDELSGIYNACFSHDGKRLIIGLTNNTISVYKFNGLNWLHERSFSHVTPEKIYDYYNPGCMATFSPNDKFITTVPVKPKTEQETPDDINSAIQIIILDSEDQWMYGELLKHDGNIYSQSITGNGRYIVGRYYPSRKEKIYLEKGWGEAYGPSYIMLTGIDSIGRLKTIDSENNINQLKLKHCAAKVFFNVSSDNCRIITVGQKKRTDYDQPDPPILMRVTKIDNDGSLTTISKETDIGFGLYKVAFSPNDIDFSISFYGCKVKTFKMGMVSASTSD